MTDLASMFAVHSMSGLPILARKSLKIQHVHKLKPSACVCVGACVALLSV